MEEFCRRFNGSLPEDMVFNSSKKFKVAAYSAMLAVAFVGNVGIAVLLIFKLSQRVNKVHLLLLHLNISDLIVTLHNMPKDIAHSYLVAWEGPGWSCRLSRFVDVFGVYLSSNVLITISLDRFWSILFPLKSLTSRSKVKWGLVLSWTVAGLSSIPQLFLWEKAFHPCFPSFGQCVQSSFLGKVSPLYDLYNTILNFMEIYVVPFVVICVCYGAILCQMLSAEGSLGGRNETPASSVYASPRSPRPASTNSQAVASLRRSTASHIDRAKQKTLQMTVAIVAVFLFCWTPYFITALIHFLDTDLATGKKRHATTVPNWLSSGLKIFSVMNSCINPYLYGYFSMNVRREAKDLWAVVRGRPKPSRQTKSSFVTNTTSSLRHGPHGRALDRSQREPLHLPSSQAVSHASPQHSTVSKLDPGLGTALDPVSL